MSIYMRFQPDVRKLLVSLIALSSSTPSAVMVMVLPSRIPSEIMPMILFALAVFSSTTKEMRLENLLAVCTSIATAEGSKNADIVMLAVTQHGASILLVPSTVPMPDEDDRVFYDAAKSAGAYLVTGNTKQYPNEPFVLTPTEFLELQSENT